MTSLDMAGVSFTILTVDPDRLALLDAPTSAPAWPSTSPVFAADRKPLVASPPKAVDEQKEQKVGSQLSRTDVQSVKKVICAISRRLVAASDQLNEWDSRVCGVWSDGLRLPVTSLRHY